MPAVIPPLALGIDIGGASARVGLVTGAGQILSQASFRTGLKIQGPQFMERLNLLIPRCLASAHNAPIAGIGIGMPAFLDPAGRVTGASNLPGLNGTPVGKLLEQRYRTPVRIENDVSAGACGEYVFGGHAGSSRRMLFLAIGTGIGAGMVVDGGLLRIARGCLGDPGHVIVDASGRWPCRCGGNGCLEAIASGWALIEQARRPGFEPTPREIFRRAQSGDARMARLAKRAAVSVGIGLATLCVILNPDTIVLGGGVALEAGEAFRLQAERTLRAHAVPFFAEQTRVMLARAGRRAGLLGAAALVLPAQAGIQAGG